MMWPPFKSLITDPESVLRASDKCRKCGGTLTLTDTVMNPRLGGRYKGKSKFDGLDRLVECEKCGWTWWVHVD